MSGNGKMRIAVILFFVFIIGVFGYLIVKESMHLKELSNQVRLTGRKISQQRTVLEQLRGLEINAENLRIQQETINMMIPEQPMEEDVLLHVQYYAEATSVPLTTIRFGERNVGTGLTEMPIDLSFRGTYKGFLNLLSNMMYGNRLLRIDEIEMDRAEDVLEINIHANAFYSNTK